VCALDRVEENGGCIRVWSVSWGIAIEGRVSPTSGLHLGHTRVVPWWHSYDFAFCVTFAQKPDCSFQLVFGTATVSVD